MVKKSIASILIALLFINSVGCFPYHEVRADERDAIEKGGRVKITTINDEIYYLTDVVVQDSIVVGMEKVNEYQNRQVKLSVKEINTVEVEKFDALMTVVGIIGFFGVMFIIALLSYGK